MTRLYVPEPVYQAPVREYAYETAKAINPDNPHLSTPCGPIFPLHVLLDPQGHPDLLPSDNTEFCFSATGDTAVSVFYDPRLGFFEQSDILRGALNEENLSSTAESSLANGSETPPEDVPPAAEASANDAQ